MLVDLRSARRSRAAGSALGGEPARRCPRARRAARSRRRMSAWVNSRTTYPPVGSTRSRPSCSSEASASRSGVRDTPSRSTSRSSDIRSPGLNSPLRICSRSAQERAHHLRPVGLIDHAGAEYCCRRFAVCKNARSNACKRFFWVLLGILAYSSAPEIRSSPRQTGAGSTKSFRGGGQEVRMDHQGPRVRMIALAAVVGARCCWPRAAAATAARAAHTRAAHRARRARAPARARAAARAARRRAARSRASRPPARRSTSARSTPSSPARTSATGRT